MFSKWLCISLLAQSLLVWVAAKEYSVKMSLVFPSDIQHNSYTSSNPFPVIVALSNPDGLASKHLGNVTLSVIIYKQTKLGGVGEKFSEGSVTWGSPGLPSSHDTVVQVFQFGDLEVDTYFIYYQMVINKDCGAATLQYSGTQSLARTIMHIVAEGGLSPDPTTVSKVDTLVYTIELDPEDTDSCPMGKDEDNGKYVSFGGEDFSVSSDDLNSWNQDAIMVQPVSSSSTSAGQATSADQATSAGHATSASQATSAGASSLSKAGMTATRMPAPTTASASPSDFVSPVHTTSTSSGDAARATALSRIAAAAGLGMVGMLAL